MISTSRPSWRNNRVACATYSGQVFTPSEIIASRTVREFGCGAEPARLNCKHLWKNETRPRLSGTRFSWIIAGKVPQNARAAHVPGITRPRRRDTQCYLALDQLSMILVLV